MENENNKPVNKTNFLLGFFAGMAVLGIISFFVLLVVVFGDKNPDTQVKAENQDNQPAAQVDNNQPTQPSQPEAPAAADVTPIQDSEYIAGNKDAKVQIIESSDFECPYCSRHSATVEKLRDEYGDKIALVFRHFPLSFHPNAPKAAMAAECAGEKGKFWEMHDKIFEASANKEMSVEKWKSLATEFGLDATQFNECLDNDKYAQKITNDMASGTSAGVQGTPATFINGELIEGAVPYEVFKAGIDQILAQ